MGLDCFSGLAQGYGAVQIGLTLQDQPQALFFFLFLVFPWQKTKFETVSLSGLEPSLKMLLHLPLTPSSPLHLWKSFRHDEAIWLQRQCKVKTKGPGLECLSCFNWHLWSWESSTGLGGRKGVSSNTVTNVKREISDFVNFKGHISYPM